MAYKQYSRQPAAGKRMAAARKSIAVWHRCIVAWFDQLLYLQSKPQEVFNGRVVIVKSTGGSTGAFAQQDALYTHCIKGIMAGQPVEQYIINSAISRVLSATEEWQEVLKCAVNPQLQIIVSNTTEVGIALLETDRINDLPPQSFPGKLLAFLYARYRAFNGSAESGMVIIPTELLVDNGNKLKEVVVQLARINNVDVSFIEWLQTANDFCNSLVDRIVPGALNENDKEALQQAFGYTDALAIMSEPYSLWAIETKSERTKALLSFSSVDEGVVIADNIYRFRELKLRLLNASHTFSCGLAFLCGFTVVNEAMNDAAFNHFLHRLMQHDIMPCMVNKEISQQQAEAFAGNVVNRFANPFIQHKWLSITLQYTGKLKSRCVPLIISHYTRSSQPPTYMALGFAAYLLFMKVTGVDNGRYYGESGGEKYIIEDDKASWFYTLWQHANSEEAVATALANADLWGEPLNTLPGFAEAVLACFHALKEGARLDTLLSLT